MNPLMFLAAEDGPHVSLKADKLFEVGGFPITSSMIYGLIISTLLVIAGLYLAKRSKVSPSKNPFVALFEMLVGALEKMLEDVFHDRTKARKYTPVFGTFFIFIMVTNITGLIPLVGSGITIDGAPVFRPFTADLNGTVAMAIIAVLIVQYYSIKESGLVGHFQHYFTDKPLNPINLFIGILEVMGEFTRILSLSLRLFLNTAVGEILIAVFAFVGAYFASFTILPIALFEMLVALIQAYVFTVLAATYLALAISHPEGEHEEDHHEQVQLSPSGAKT